MPAIRVSMWRFLPAALLVLLPFRGMAAEAPFPHAKAIDDLVQEAMKVWQVPGAAVVIVDRTGEVYLKGFGVRRQDGNEPVTPDTLFPVSSCSKAFTTLALAMLVDDGKLAWDDPVRKHVPKFHLADPLADRDILVRDLLCHRCGLAGHDFLWYHAPWNIDEQIRRIGLVKPSRPFRSAFQYQSIMFAAAGKAVEHASGAGWDAFVRERIFQPLEMTSASCTTAEALKMKDRAGGHRWDRDGKRVAVDWCPFPEPNAAVSVNATARDLGKWVRFQLGDGSWGINRLVSAENLAETHMPQMVIRMEGAARREQPFATQISYGMGWVIQDYRGHKLIGHAGNLDGARTHIAFLPDEGIGLAILANLQDTRMNLALSNAIFDELLGVERFDWNDFFLKAAQEMAEEYEKKQPRHQEGTKPTLDLSAYAGTYEEPAYGRAEISAEKGTLVLKWSSFRTPLEHYHVDVFTPEDTRFRRQRLTFQLTGREATGFRFLDVEFRRAAAK